MDNYYYGKKQQGRAKYAHNVCIKNVNKTLSKKITHRGSKMREMRFAYAVHEASEERIVYGNNASPCGMVACAICNAGVVMSAERWF